MNHDELLSYYTTPGVFTSVEGFEKQIDALPDDVASIAEAVQGLLLHEAWAPAYKVTPSQERLGERELHSACAMLRRATELDQRPVGDAREPDHRTLGCCRHFATLFIAFLRHKGIPSRVRAGFAGYFETPKYVDHWVGEYWNAKQERWVLVDPQLDELQRTLIRADFEVDDVPRDRFLVGGDAWRVCRSGQADPDTFGVGGTEMWGLVEVMGDVFQDLAALQKVELLPWGWYGLAADGDAWESELDLIDRLAALSSKADAGAMAELRTLVEADARLAPPMERVEATREAELATT